MNSLANPRPNADLEHGGALTAARELFPNAPEPFLDLSTGINPHPYPIPDLSSEVFTRLPDPAAIRRLSGIAAHAYRAPSSANVVPAPGTQILLTHVATLVPPGNAAVLGPTYAEHVRMAAFVGHNVEQVDKIDHLKGADIAIVVNPNNPDGRIVTREVLLGLANDLGPHALLVIDEAFVDVSSSGISLADEVGRGNIIVLRSFGKFFGLAGLRLGFALAAPQIASRLTASLGPWAVSGPAIAIGEAALADEQWIEATRTAIAEAVCGLDRLLAEANLEIIGGTSLFRLVRTPSAAALFHHLGRAGILVRHFSENPTWLRFGLPGAEPDWQRLRSALRAYRHNPAVVRPHRHRSFRR
jgi:cobalamin biosynthetic protein CobC